ncbi:proton-coupled amino acid transporter-like protein CG1139 isoform X2 [Sitophilus oryzae]|uniref:Proton-coupled amino acid transporter-like protein CG1139 isoform X2 n=1 Tax=Sitophilus oryzae TaxID=7048 RepID=A0A6J2X471_SITOR|nr:proton-coupled amino acid transporter-like protein CG1139 isoform X2 [Sitophilus oryzae]
MTIKDKRITGGLGPDNRNDSFNSFSAAINSRELLTPKDNAHTYILELNELKKKEAGEYNPHEYADIEHPTTFFETLIHLLKSSFGTGILAMPLAFSHSGWVLGIIGTAFIGLLCTYCMHMLVKTEYDLCKKKQVPSMTYPATAEAALMEGPRFMAKVAPYSGTISNTFLLLYQLGTCCVYTVFVAENIQNVCNQYFEHPVDERIIMLIILLPLIFINYIRNLKFLAPLTTMANLLTFVSFAIIFYYIFKTEITFENRLTFGNYRDYPLYFGTVLFALEAIGVIMPLKNEMKNPQHFGSACGVLNIGMFSVVALYILTGFFGYLAYGAEVGGSISYTIEPSDIAAQVCKLMLAFAIFTTHALSMYVAIDIVWTQNLVKKFEKNNHPLFWEYFIRTCLVILTFCLAVAVPYIDLFISLVGAFCISSLGVAFPAIMDSCNKWQERRSAKSVLNHVKNVAIVIFAFLGLIVGTVTSVQKIVEKFGPEST